MIVLPDGEVLDLSEPREEPEGLDLVGFFVGSEGTLGIATEATVRLTPIPERTETLLAMYRSLEAACDTVSTIIAAQLQPSAIEILDKLTIEAVEASVFRAGYPTGVEAVLLMDVDGTEEEVSELVGELERVITDHGGYDLRRASSAPERTALWAGRKGAFGAMGRIAPDLYVADAVVPRTKLRELVAYCTEVARARNLKLANVFHAGDGNLHPNLCYDRRDTDEVRRVLEAGDLILRRCIELGGSLSGEHGIGVEKRDLMCDAFSQASLDAMLAVRRAWDPAGRMNPTKLLPTRACLEIHTKPIPISAEGA
jgi:FAD/FMN-containing dehydrogenase